MEIAKLEALIGADVKPLTAALSEAKTQLTNFGNTGATSLQSLNTGLSNTAKAAILAGTDIKSLTAALDVLQFEQAKFAQGTQTWRLYQQEIRNVNTQLNVLEGQLPVVTAEMKTLGTTSTSSLSGMGKGLTSVWSGLRQIAYILPGLGIAGLFNLAFVAIAKAADELGIFNSEAKKLRDATKEAIEGFADEAAQVNILVTELRNENFTRKEKEGIIKRLQDIAPAYFNNLKIEGSEIKNLTDDYQRYGRAILLISKIKAASKFVDENQAKVLKQQLEISESIAFARANAAKMHDPQSFILSELERDLAVRTRLAKEIAPVMNIILETQKELNAIGGDPHNPLDVEKLKKTKKELEEIAKQAGAIARGFTDINAAAASVANSGPLPDLLGAPKTEDLTALFNKLNEFKETDIFENFNEQLEGTKEIARELASIFADLFTDLVTKGRISFQKLAQEVARFIAKLIEAVIQALLLKAIMAAITGGTSTISGNSLGGGLGGIYPHAEGGIFDQPTLIGNHLFGEKGPEALIPLNQLANMIGNMGGTNLTINGDFRVQGSDLVLALNRGNIRMNRNYGNNFN